MAENDSGQEKTEDPTTKRLEKAKEDGQVPRSKELTTTAVLLCSMLAFLFFGPNLYQKIGGLTELTFTLPREAAFDPQYMFSLLSQSMYESLIGLFPFFIILLIASIAGPIALGGWLFSTKSLLPKLNRMDPLEGLKRMFSIKSLVELLKAVAKVLLVGSLAVFLINALQFELLSLAKEDVDNAIGHAIQIALWVAIGLSLSTILIAIADIPFQIWDNTKKLKMSVQDIKDEMKDTDGKPEVKSRIRQLQQQMANSRMMADVPDADVIITNPTHYSVAIKYKPEQMTTPIVVAKGVDQIALKIREIAGAHEIDIVESPVLTRAIYHTTSVGEEVPSELYVAVAKILAYVFQLRAFRRGRGERPGFPHQVPVPDDLVFD